MTRDLKNVQIILDENQICTLSTMINTIFADYPIYASARSDAQEIKRIIEAAVDRAVR